MLENSMLPKNMQPEIFSSVGKREFKSYRNKEPRYKLDENGLGIIRKRSILRKKEVAQKEMDRTQKKSQRMQNKSFRVSRRGSSAYRSSRSNISINSGMSKSYNFKERKGNLDESSVDSGEILAPFPFDRRKLNQNGRNTNRK